MKDFDQLCKEFEKMDEITYSVILLEKAKTVLPALSALTNDGIDGVTLFATFILGAIVADNNLSKAEYAITLPLFKVFFGENINYESCGQNVKKMRSENKELTKLTDAMVDMIGELSEDLKADIILICLMICAIDGKVSAKEKRWIKKLIK